VVLFFEKGSPTRKIWYYQLKPNRNLGKTNPLNEDDLTEFLEMQKIKADSETSWSVDIADVNLFTYDLSVKNPNDKTENFYREPLSILEEIKRLDKESENILAKIRGLL